MTEYVLFIDDERNPTDNRFHSNKWLDGSYPIVIVRSSKAAIDHVKKNGLPIHFCFDHDLGVWSNGTDTVKNFINWLFNEYQPDTILSYSVHSDNPTAKSWIDSMFQSYARVLINK